MGIGGTGRTVGTARTIRSDRSGRNTNTTGGAGSVAVSGLTPTLKSPRRTRQKPTLADVSAAIVSCELCPRLRLYCQRIGHEKRRAFRDDTYWAKPVPGFGDPQARLLIVGLAPAAHGANRTGRVFTGDGGGGSGDFLMAALHRAGFANIPTSQHPSDGLALRDAYIAAAVRCAPPDNKPTPEEIARCLPHLEAELAALPRVSVVVALGRIAFDAYLRLLTRSGVATRPRPQFGHGRAHHLPNGQTLFGCYHPSRQNTNTGKLTSRMMDDIFKRVREVLGIHDLREVMRVRVVQKVR
jgi:uracil-DNA glycosylase family 4